MLMYGLDRDDILNIRFSGEGIVYNLSSYKEGFVSIKKLLPPNSLGAFSGRDFDIQYTNYIMNNDLVFAEFFQIIYNLYIGKNIFILYSDSDWSENIMESLIKLIQQRYGYNAVRIDSDEDYIYAMNTHISDSFAQGYGLYNLDIDKERFAYIILKYMAQNNGVPPFGLEGFVVNEDE